MTKRQPYTKPPNPVVSFMQRLLGWVVAGAVLAVCVVAALGAAVVTVATPQNSQNIVIVNKTIEAEKGSIMLASLDPQESRAQFVTFDSQLKTEVVGGYGRYELRSIYPLLMLDEKPAAEIRATLTFSLDRAVDTIWSLESVPQVTTKDQAKQLLLALAWGSQPSSLGLIDRVWLGWFAWRLEVSRVLLDTVKTEKELASADFLSLAFKPECTIAVINTTSISGVAGRVTKIFENSGGRVVRVADTPATLETSRVAISTDSNCLEVAEKVQQVVPTAIAIERSEQITAENRAEVVILLGKDVAMLLSDQR